MAGINHSWDLSEADAIVVQQQYAPYVIEHDNLEPVQYVAGIDVGYHSASDALIAVIAILNSQTLECVEVVEHYAKATFPYIPGLFAFREMPSVLAAFNKLTITPQLLVCDAAGKAHPRRFGLASHLGLWLDIPSIGCAKTLPFGQFTPPSNQRGAYSNITDQGEVIGYAVRTQDDIKEVYVSVGYKISLDTAKDWVLKLSKFRLPETTRVADHHGRMLLKNI